MLVTDESIAACLNRPTAVKGISFEHVFYDALMFPELFLLNNVSNR